MLTIVDVFTLAGRGTAVVGLVGSGVLQTGEEVEVWDDRQLIASTRATLELICSPRADPRSIGLLLRGVGKHLVSPGQTVRRTATKT